jgi:hypothetical protein
MNLSNQITTANAGWRWQFRFRGSRHRPGVAEFYRSGSMKRYAFVIAWILLGLTATAAELKPKPDLTAPSTGDEKRVAEIREVGTRWWMQSRGLLAEESVRVVGYFRVIRPIPQFAERDDRVWEVRIIHLEGAPTGVLWINDKTQKVMALGLPDPERTEPGGAANGSQPIRSETNRTSSAAGSRR